MPTDWANPGGTTTPTAHIAITTDGQGAPAGPFPRYVQSSQPILSCFACFASFTRQQKSKAKIKIHRDRRKKQRGAECFVICREARRNRIDFCLQKKKQLQKKVLDKKSRTNGGTQAYLGFWCSNPKLGCLVQDGSWHRRLLTSTIPSS